MANSKVPKLAEVAARIQAHLLRIVKDPAHEDWCRRAIVKMPTARPSGAYVAIYFRPSAGALNVAKDEALEYLQWLDEGNVGMPSERLWNLSHARALDKRETQDDEVKLYPVTVNLVPTDVYRMTWEEFKFLLIWSYYMSRDDASDWVREHHMENGQLPGTTQVVEVKKAMGVPLLKDCMSSGLRDVLRDAANREAIPEGLYILSDESP